MKTAVIFGSSGQDGFYLSNLLNKKQIKTICISRNSGDIIGDISNLEFVNNITKTKPDYIFNLAATSSTNHNSLFLNHNSISTGTINLLESVYRFSKKSKVFLCGSAMQFENDGTPINESTAFESNSPYSFSRIHSVYAARYYRSHLGLKIYVGYLFNHDSPLRKENHINQKIVQSVIRISKGSSEKLLIGNIKVKKEFNFAGDIVEAIWDLVSQSNFFEAVIGSGIAYSIKDWLEYCFSSFNLNWTSHVEINENFKSDYKILVSQPNLIKSTGWRPKVDFSQLADMMITYKYTNPKSN